MRTSNTRPLPSYRHLHCVAERHNIWLRIQPHSCSGWRGSFSTRYQQLLGPLLLECQEPNHTLTSRDSQRLSIPIAFGQLSHSTWMVVVASMTNTINFHSGPHQDPFVLWKSGSSNSNNAKARGPVRNSHPPWNIGLQIGLCGFGMPAAFPNLEILTQEPPIQPSSAQAGSSAGSRQNAETI